MSGVKRMRYLGDSDRTRRRHIREAVLKEMELFRMESSSDSEELCEHGGLDPHEEEQNQYDIIPIESQNDESNTSVNGENSNNTSSDDVNDITINQLDHENLEQQHDSSRESSLTE